MNWIKRLFKIGKVDDPKNSALNISAVSGRSEQLLCGNLIRHNFSLIKIGICYECKFIKDKAK